MKTKTSLQAGCTCQDHCTKCKTPEDLSFCAYNCMKVPDRKWNGTNEIVSENYSPSVHWRYAE